MARTVVQLGCPSASQIRSRINFFKVLALLKNNKIKQFAWSYCLLYWKFWLFNAFSILQSKKVHLIFLQYSFVFRSPILRKQVAHIDLGHVVFPGQRPGVWTVEFFCYGPVSWPFQHFVIQRYILLYPAAVPSALYLPIVFWHRLLSPASVIPISDCIFTICRSWAAIGWARISNPSRWKVFKRCLKAGCFSSLVLSTPYL